MDIRNIQELINKYPYEDARAKILECNHFGDEVTLIYESTHERDILE